MDFQLEKLRLNVKYLEWKYDSCHYFWKKEYWDEVKKAKQQLKEYKEKYYPETQLITNTKPTLRMDDWVENLENYAN